MKKMNIRPAGWIDSLDQVVRHARRGQRPVLQWMLIRAARTALLAAEGFTRHHGPLRASALTFYSLLSLVPVAAMAFGIAKGFGFERRLEQELLEKFSSQREVVAQVIGFARNMLENTEGGVIAGVGIVVLFWSVIKVLSNIENSFNHIWTVRSRSPMRKLTDYLTVMLIGPVLVILSSSVTLFITTRATDISGRLPLLWVAGPVLYVALKLLPYFLIWVLFTLVYMIMPNTRVPLTAALPAGVIAGSAFQALQAAYIHFQIFTSKYNAIYGSFAALPLFLLWLQISWFIVLIGAEISHAFQHSADVVEADLGKPLRISELRLLALAICRHVVQRFHQNLTALNTAQIAEQLAVAPALVDKVAGLLVQENILVPIQNEESRERFLQPARDIGSLTVNTVLSALEDAGERGYPSSVLPEIREMSRILEALRSELDRSPANRRMVDL